MRILVPLITLEAKFDEFGAEQGEEDDDDDEKFNPNPSDLANFSQPQQLVQVNFVTNFFTCPTTIFLCRSLAKL